MLECTCGNKTNKLRYKNGIKQCDKCAPQNLSGQFLRHMEGEARYYSRDILQKYNKDGSLNEDFEEVYGEGRNTETKAAHRKAKKVGRP